MVREIRHRRLSATVAIALTLAFVGFFVGIRKRSSEGSSFPEPSGRSARYTMANTEVAAPLARSNATLAIRPWSTTERRFEPLTDLPLGPIALATAETRATAIAARAQRRAFAGAPPTIPHPVGQGSSVECRACHENGALIGQTRAPVRSHDRFTMCTQCHVPETAPHLQGELRTSAAATVESSFVGQDRALEPYRWALGAPPQIPHRTFMRERCLSCHGRSGPVGLQTPHVERSNCQQCHAPSAQLNQRGQF